jgi:hypothetical protein
LVNQGNELRNELQNDRRSLTERLDSLEAKFNIQNPIRLEIVDEGNFNFPISSIPKGEGVGELKLPESLPEFFDYKLSLIIDYKLSSLMRSIVPESLPVVDPILEVVSSDLPSVPNPVAESSPIPFYECPITREETICPTISVQLEEKVEKNISCQNQVAFLIFFYEFEIPKRYLRMFLHLEDFLYDIYEYNISKFLLW